MWRGESRYFSMYTSATPNAASASISFISFMASMMHITWPGLTRSPTSTNEAELGSGER